MSMFLLNRLERLDYLIRSRATGTPQELAERLEISERRLYDILNEMRDLGAPIKYSKTLRTYYYARKGKLSVRFNELL